MEDIEISYSISAEDFSHANSLLRGKSGTFRRAGSRHLFMAAIVFVVLIFYQQRYGYTDALWSVLLLPGVYLLYWAGLCLFPSFLDRYRYKPAMAREVYTGRFSADRVTVTGKAHQWNHRWDAFQQMEEDDQMFMLFDGMTVFVFSKRFFAPEQVIALQALIKTSRPALQA